MVSLATSSSSASDGDLDPPPGAGELDDAASDGCRNPPVTVLVCHCCHRQHGLDLLGASSPPAARPPRPRRGTRGRCCPAGRGGRRRHRRCRRRSGPACRSSRCLGVADERQPGAADRLLGLVGAVRDGQAVAHVGGHRPLPVVHRVDVGRVDRAGGHQQLAGLVDGLVAGAGRARQHDRLVAGSTCACARRAPSAAVRRRRAAATARRWRCCQQLDDLVVLRAGHEVVDRDVHRRRGLAGPGRPGPGG